MALRVGWCMKVVLLVLSVTCAWIQTLISTTHVIPIGHSTGWRLGFPLSYTLGQRKWKEGDLVTVWCGEESRSRSRSETVFLGVFTSIERIQVEVGNCLLGRLHFHREDPGYLAAKISSSKTSHKCLLCIHMATTHVRT